MGAAHAWVLRDQGTRCFRTYQSNIARALEGCEVSSEVRAGHPALEIMVATAELDADLIVMASRGRRGISERRRGSVADKVLRGSSVPILIVGPAILRRPSVGPVTLRSLLLPLDGSRESESGLGVALDVARAKGAHITLLRVVPSVVSGVGIGLREAYPPELAQHLMKSAQGYLKQFKVAHPEIIVSTVVERGSPSQAIVQLEERLGPYLVVMASRSRYSGGRWALGSVADDVIEGPVPVVVVRPATVAAKPPNPGSIAVRYR